MYKNKKILALIPARGGSKGLPRKNIRLLYGKPLIAWSIEQAKESKFVDKVIVSTDDSEIAKISKEYGAEIPFIRPQELATDEIKCIDVILHAIDFMNKIDTYDIVLLLQPTSPLRIPKDIDNSIELLFEKKAKAIISVCETEHHPHQTNTLPDDGSMKDFRENENLNKNRQDFGKFYIDDGAIYLGFCTFLKKQRSFFGEGAFAYVIPKDRAVDVDSEADFRIAEALKKNL